MGAEDGVCAYASKAKRVRGTALHGSVSLEQITGSSYHKIHGIKSINIFSVAVLQGSNGILHSV